MAKMIVLCSAWPSVRHRVVPGGSLRPFSPRVLASSDRGAPLHHATPLRRADATTGTPLEGGVRQVYSAAPLPLSGPLLQTWWQSLLRGFATFALFLSLSILVPYAAQAGRTGGRMGGSNFSRSMSHSSCSFSPSYSSGGGSWSCMRGPSRVSVNSFFFPSYGVGYGFGGSSLFSLVFYAFAAYLLFSAVQRWRGESEGAYDEEYPSERATVCKVQVGLLGLARGLQTDLDTIARRADTSSPQGLHFLLQETLLALNRNPDYCIYGAADVKRARSMERAEMGFNRMSMTERGKIKEETLSNWEGRTSEKGVLLQKQTVGNELIVVTILVAASGDLKLPKVRSKTELNEALNRLGSVRARDVLAVEVLWTPQDENDTYTPEELMSDYPELVAL